MVMTHLDDRSWKEIKEICPIKCRAAHLEQGEHMPLKGKASLKFRAVAGELTVEEKKSIWIFSHPGFNEDIHIKDFNRNMKPGTASVYFF
jgi:hypothetical protein